MQNDDSPTGHAEPEPTTPQPTTPEPTEGDAPPTAGPAEPLPVGQRWWFSPMLWVVAGGAITAFQWGPISGGTANWLNWLVAAAGIAVLVGGAVSLGRESRRRQRRD